MSGNNEIYSSFIQRGIVKKDTHRFFRKLVGIFFRRVELDEESLLNINEHVDKGKIVYASMQTTSTSMFILLDLLSVKGISVPSLALGFVPYTYQKLKAVFFDSIVFFRKIFKSDEKSFVSNIDYMRKTLENNDGLIFSMLSRKLFMRRYVKIKTDSIEYLLQIQKDMDEPIFVFPQVIFWNRNPERTRSFFTSSATGDRGLFSGFFITRKSATPAFLRIGKPVNLKEEIENSETDDIKHLSRNVRNKLLDIYNYEKRSILGPQLKTQQEMMEKVLYHRNVLDAIGEEMTEKNLPEKKLRRKAYGYYREIAADFSIIYIRFFKATNDYLFRKIFDGIHYDIEEFKRIREASEKGPLILVPSHKSHMDYIIISSIFYHNKLIPPHILSGANLTFFPMGKIFRRSGAFFMRRTFKGLNLYAAVFKQYVKTLVHEGYTIEFFIEGTRSRTGKVISPKLGMLKYLIESIDEGYNKDLVFVPITVNYDRILEEGSYQKELKGKEKTAESTSSFIKSRKLIKRKYGTVYLSLNEPFTLSEVREQIKNDKNIENIEDLTIEMGDHIVKRINDIVMVTPFALTTAALLYTTTRGFSREMILERMEKILGILKLFDAKLSDPLKSEGNLNEITDMVFDSYTDDKIISKIEIDDDKSSSDESGGEDLYIINQEERARINFYKNSIMHMVIPANIMSLAVISTENSGKTTQSKVKAEFEKLRETLSKEFIYPDVMDDTEILYEKITGHFSDQGILSVSGNELVLAPGGIDHLKFFAGMIQDYLESKRIVVSAVFGFDKDKASKKDVVTEIRKTGIKMYHLNEIKCSESLSMSNYNNVLSRLNDVGVIAIEGEGKTATIAIKERQKAGELLEDINIYLSKIR